MRDVLPSVLLPDAADLRAPDLSEIRLLTVLPGGSMVHCRLRPGAVSVAVTHRTVEEHWFVLSGQGEIWRAKADREEMLRLEPQLALTIPLGTRFQFRATGAEPLDILIVTMPPWPGADEALPVTGPWQARGESL